ncbi:transglutaminase-like domain-containing protein [Alteraurantiacibacter buctensis]|uniref:Transglutaminase family protein n=1 Tax=Alteraurantiacibacter buctensis TaxID=1503981 RepID=A0A844Z0A4_9SPHN|nr:transglutaminase family protein [Alteraurantiacibacter buctensis]MXO73239.1 transglutaminase family protein [Alteraurantiacibacter buctensis]
MTAPVPPTATLSITVELGFALPQAGDVLLQFEAAAIPEQELVSTGLWLTPVEHFARVAAQDTIGDRIWLRVAGDCSLTYRATVAVQRKLADLATLDALLPHDLPGEAVPYLLDSRYCQAMRLQSMVADEFGHLAGGAKVLAMRDWIAGHLTYEGGRSTADTTAIDTLVDRRGVCRDYAHLLVTMARAAAIPARFVSCFAPGVDPPDFHAVAEVFLADPSIPGGGAWHMVDATGMADPAQTVKIGVGRDAADVSFLSAFDPCDFGWHKVTVLV